ncbi:tail fiber/spike domain-containing protein, partial [Proteus sp. G4441]
MTVSTELSHEEYVGNGVTTDFDFRFRIFESKHLIVVVADSEGNETTLKNGTDYTIVGAGSYHGGKVVLNKPLAQGWKILLERDLPVVQETDLRNQGKFFAEVHEDAFDYLTMLIQKALGTFSLSLRKPTYLSNYYDAKGNRIANLASPKLGADAVNKDYVDNSIKDIDSKTLRVKDKAIPALPSAEQRRNKQLGFDNEGYPQLLDPAETGSLGYVLVDSFEKGAEITTRYQALHWESNGEYYRWDGELPKFIPIGSTPDKSGGIGVGAWMGIGYVSLKYELGFITKTFKTISELQSDGNITVGSTVDVLGFHLVGFGKSSWIKTSEIVEPNKLPIALGEFAISDKYGYKYTLVENLANGITIEQLGALPYDNTNPSVKHDLSPFWLLIMKVQKLRGTSRLNVGFENRSYFSSKGMVTRGYTSYTAAGKYSVQMFIGQEKWSEDEIPHKTISGITTWYSLQTFQFGVVHDSNNFAQSILLSGFDFVTASGFHTDYGLYTPYMADSEIKYCRFVGNNIGHEFRNVYSNSFDRLVFTARTNTENKAGAYSIRGRERANGVGTGTSNIFSRCGYTDYTLGFLIEGMAYSSFISCYTEGNQSESIGTLIKMNNGVSIIEWGCERLTSRRNNLPLLRISESVVDINGINFTWNVNANNNTVVLIDTNSVSSIYGINARGMINASNNSFIKTDDISDVFISHVQYPINTGNVSTINNLGLNTYMIGKGGNQGALNNIVEHSYEFNNANSKTNIQN